MGYLKNSSYIINPIAMPDINAHTNISSNKGDIIQKIPLLVES
jgi:hypothetical protein